MIGLLLPACHVCRQADEDNCSHATQAWDTSHLDLTASGAKGMCCVCFQGSSDRLQAQVQTLQANSAQAELAELQTVISQLQQQLEAKQAEVLMLKEREGGSNKAADVIRALENQVHKLTSCCCRQAWSAHLYMFGTPTVLRCLT